MADPELGTKQVCPECESRFYDLRKRPATCPKCGHAFDPDDEATQATKAKVQTKKTGMDEIDDSENDDDEEGVGINVMDADDSDDEHDGEETTRELGDGDDEVVIDMSNSDDDENENQEKVSAGFNENQDDEVNIDEVNIGGGFSIDEDDLEEENDATGESDNSGVHRQEDN